MPDPSVPDDSLASSPPSTPDVSVAAPHPRFRLRSPGVWIAIGVALLLCIGGITAVVVVATKKAPAPRRMTPPITLTAPDLIGTLKKLADAEQSDSRRESLRSAGLNQPFDVTYEDSTTAGHTVGLWGGIGKAIGRDGAQTALDAFFASAAKDLGEATLGTRITVATGLVGGKLQCAKVEGLKGTATMCAWSDNGAILGFMFTGLDQDQAAEQAKTILPSIVVKG